VTADNPPAPTPAGAVAQPALPSPLDAVPDMRATAKWILAAAAAAGAALIGGAPLTAVGKLHGWGDAISAYLGLVIGLAGIGWAIWRTADALIPPLTTPLSVDNDAALNDLRNRIALDPTAYYGPFGHSMTDLREQYAFHRGIVLTLARAQVVETDPMRKQVMQAQSQEAQATVAAAAARMSALLSLAHAWQVRAQLRDARLHALGGAAVAAAGAVLFLVATS